MLTQIGCNVCGKAISNAIDVPESFQIHGWIECVECLLRKGPPVDFVVRVLVERFMREEFYHGSNRRRAEAIDAAAREIVRGLDNIRFLAKT